MESLRDKFVKDILESERYLESASHIVTVTMPVVKDNKLLIRALEALHKSAKIVVGSILKYEYMFKRIDLAETPEKNLELFFDRCAEGYGMNEVDAAILKEIFFLGKKHIESGFEFSRSGKTVIMDDELGTFELNIDKSKAMVKLLERLIDNAKNNFRGVEEN